ncbi:hypothetical protein GCM10010315_10150 [Streptomyces luteosporeus]|uniref:Uncharacterized protein n=1 Tax=Streptomyces luteosporeus TaxID=173856 RepID=A0ABP6G1C6_9ACTN
MAAGRTVDPARWQETFEGLMSRIAGRFARTIHGWSISPAFLVIRGGHPGPSAKRGFVASLW